MKETLLYGIDPTATVSRVAVCTGYYWLEVVLLPGVAVSEEGDGVGHHPDVAAPAVVVRLVPLSILVAHR